MSRTALITGGSSGLGLEMARQLKEKDYNLILVARDAEKLNRVSEQLASKPGTGSIRTISCDVSDDEAIEAAFKSELKADEHIDFLVVNAGITTIDLLKDYENVSAITRDLKVNLLGAIATTYLCMSHLKQDSHILFVSSGFGLVGAPGYSLYCASKAGLNNFADALRREVKDRGIHVHVTCPGDIDTPMYAGELEIMPDWIKEKMGRAKPMHVEPAAKYILDKCFKNQFMIIPSGDVKGLMAAQKLLPRRVSTKIFDNLLPTPPV